MSQDQSTNSGVSWFGRDVDATTRNIVAAQFARSEIDVVVVPADERPWTTNPWRRLPSEIAVLVAAPETVAAVACRKSVAATRDSLWQAVLERLEAGLVLVELRFTAGQPSVVFPDLAPASAAELPRWRRQRIDELPKRLAGQIVSPPDIVALQAGLLQIADQLDASHELSQSIEGEGIQRAGDYWHAINHRREPDYGNAKYWFRHVGNHPLLADLAETAVAIAAGQSKSLETRATEMTTDGRLDPFRFVDFVEQVSRSDDSAAKSFAAALQWAEMIGLLAWTWRDVTGDGEK